MTVSRLDRRPTRIQVHTRARSSMIDPNNVSKKEQEMNGDPTRCPKCARSVGFADVNRCRYCDALLPASVQADMARVAQENRVEEQQRKAGRR